VHKCENNSVLTELSHWIQCFSRVIWQIAILVLVWSFYPYFKILKVRNSVQTLLPS